MEREAFGQRALAQVDRAVSKMRREEPAIIIAEDGSRTEIHYRSGFRSTDDNLVRQPAKLINGSVVNVVGNDIVHYYGPGGDLRERKRVKQEPQSLRLLSYEERYPAAARPRNQERKFVTYSSGQVLRHTRIRPTSWRERRGTKPTTSPDLRAEESSNDAWVIASMGK